MPEYLAPGVYVEETSFRSKSIEGVGTTTTGFIGPARFGPTDIEPELITSLAAFERIYGDGRELVFTDQSGKMPNYLWQAVRAFFAEGGSRLYVSRVFTDPSASDEGLATETFNSGSTPAIDVEARFPGVAGELRVAITLEVAQNALAEIDGNPVINGLTDRDLVLIDHPDGQASGLSARLYLAKLQSDGSWEFDDGSNSLTVGDVLGTDSGPGRSGNQIHRVTATVTVSDPIGGRPEQVWKGLALDPGHSFRGAGDSIFDRFAATDSIASRAEARSIPVVLRAKGITDGTDTIAALEGAYSGSLTLTDLLSKIVHENQDSTDAERTVGVRLSGGKDGKLPEAVAYEGDDESGIKTGLKQFEDLEEIAIVAAPGATAGYANDQARGDTIISHLLGHCDRMRYRVAVIDSGDGQTLGQVSDMRAKFDSSYAAFYYPWVRVLDPITGSELALPPSGFMAGIYARNDVERAVYKAPANEVVNLAIGFEQRINKAQQELLNPRGINCLRFFEGRGFRVWGARTMSSDPEWKYLNVRRYFAYLERSIDLGTQWAVFEPNGEALWANVRRTVESFLLNEFKSGALLGSKPEQAYFVRCDRSTMTQNDIDNGRLICLIGVAPLKPAEFVIFRIGQWTGDA